MKERSIKIRAYWRNTIFHCVIFGAILGSCIFGTLSHAYKLKKYGTEELAFISGLSETKLRRGGTSKSIEYTCNGHQKWFSVGFLGKLSDNKHSRLIPVLVSSDSPDEFTPGCSKSSLIEIAHLNTFNQWSRQLLFSTALFGGSVLLSFLFRFIFKGFDAYLKHGRSYTLNTKLFALAFTACLFFMMAAPLIDFAYPPATPEISRALQPIEEYGEYKIYRQDSTSLIVQTNNSIHKITSSEYKTDFHTFHPSSSVKKFHWSRLLCISSHNNDSLTLTTFLGNEINSYRFAFDDSQFPELNINKHTFEITFEIGTTKHLIAGKIHKTIPPAPAGSFSKTLNMTDYGKDKNGTKKAVFSRFNDKSLVLSPSQNYYGVPIWDFKNINCPVTLNIIYSLSGKENSLYRYGTLYYSEEFHY